MPNAVIGALRVNLGIDTAAFSAGLTQAQGKLAAFGRAAQPAVAAVAAVGVAAAASGAALVSAFVTKQMDVLDMQSKLAARFGGTVAAIQTLEQAASLGGVSSEDLAKSIGVLNSRLGEAARTGAGAAFDAFQRLGLSVQELSNMDVDTRIATIADRMAELGLSTQQQADFLRQVGIRSQDMITLLQGGGDAIRSARTDIEDFGIAVSDIDAKKIEMANDAITQIGKVAEGVGNQIAIRLAPYIYGISTALTDAARKSGGFGAAITASIDAAIDALGALGDKYRWLEILNLRYQKSSMDAGRFLRASVGADTADLDAQIASMNAQIDELSKKQLPSTFFKDFIKKANEAADVAAKLQLGDDANKPPPPPPPPTEEDQKTAARYQDQLNAKLEQLQASLLTEREAELNSYAERMTDLQDFLDAGLLTKQEYAEMALAVEADHAKRVQELDQQTAEEAKKSAQMRFGAINSLADSASSIIGELFEGSKAAAIAQTVINTGQAVMSTYAQYGGTPWGIAAAAAVAATGAAQIAMMSRTNRHSSISSGSSASKTATPATPVGGDTSGGSTSTLFVQGISSNQLFSGDTVRDLAQKLLDYQSDGGKVVLA